MEFLEIQPPRSSDLNDFNNFWYGHLKSIVYSSNLDL